MKTEQLTAKTKKTRQKRPQTPQTDFFTTLCRSDLKVECVKEFRFHPTRKWRFDYAIPEHRIAIEIDGGVWTQGRHTRPQGYLNDLEKFNMAASMGWVVLKFTPDSQYKTATMNIIRETINTRINERNMETNQGQRGTI